MQNYQRHGYKFATFQYKSNFYINLQIKMNFKKMKGICRKKYAEITQGYKSKLHEKLKLPKWKLWQISINASVTVGFYNPMWRKSDIFNDSINKPIWHDSFQIFIGVWQYFRWPNAFQISPACRQDSFLGHSNTRRSKHRGKSGSFISIQNTACSTWTKWDYYD